MAESQILEFAGNPTALVQTYAQYLADLQRIVGNQPGLARPEFVNKVLNQTSKMSAALAQFIVDQSGNSVLDSDSVATIKANMVLAIQAIISASGGVSWNYVGLVVPCPVSGIPTGFLECNGAAVSKTTYANLYAFMKDSGDAAIYGETGTNFYLPDYRGRFMRGWDHGIARDPDRASRIDRGDGITGDNVGTLQDDQTESHTHMFAKSGISFTAMTLTTQYFAQTGGIGGEGGYYGAASTSTPDVGRVGFTGGNETRPANINTMWIIKY
jgi:microcystin-dependent protein